MGQNMALVRGEEVTVPDGSTLALFVVTVLALVTVPGPNIIYIVTRSIHQGRSAGLVSALGVEVGTFVHIIAATLGLSALLASSATAFAVVKYAGAAYLLYLGIRTILTRGEGKAMTEPTPARAIQVFGQGIAVNVLNPKTALFFLAFLPQFVDPARGSVATQTLILGSIVVTIGTLNNAVYAVLASRLGDVLRHSARFRATERWVSGCVYLGLGVVTALSGSDRR